VLGLAIGLSAGFIILQYVAYEMGYDQFYDQKEDIYRIQTNRYNKGELTTQWAGGAAGAGYHLKENFPEIQAYTQLKESEAMISVDRQYFKPQYPYYASATFFEVMGLSLKRGVDSTALKDPYTAVISESWAKKLFNGENPVGKVIRQNDNTDFTITGVFEDFPENSHMKFDLLYSFETYVSFTSEDVRTELDWDGFLNYVRLKPGSNADLLEAKFPAVLERIYQTTENYISTARIELLLQHIEDIHLTSNYRREIKQNGSERTTYFLAIIGMFVLFIAWINYINLTTANSMKRAKEVGVRKVLGSFRKQLIGQFMFESAFINILALVLATIIVGIGLPYFNRYLGRSADYIMPEQSWFWIGLTVVFLAGIVLSGIYPSLVLSSFKPVTTLKGIFSHSEKGHALRKGLVIFQYLSSIVLITGTYVVYQQLQHLKQQDLGVTLEQTLILEAPVVTTNDSIFVSKLEAFKNELLSYNTIGNMTTSTAIPGQSPNWNAGGIRLLTQREDESNQYRVLGIDEEFIDFYGLDLVAGRKFDRSFGSEHDNILINEASLTTLGLQNAEEALKEKLYFWGDTFNIVGVVKNYRQESPKSSYDGHIFRYDDWWSDYYSLRIKSADMPKTLAFIEENWRLAYGEQPLDYYFLDDHYNKQYRAELNFGTIFGLFSILAIIVACLGLFGLASFMTELRLKEVSVRKVLGASFSSLWTMLTTDFLKLVCLAIVISFPLSWWLMDHWLNNFASRINLSVTLFLIPALLLILISIATVSYHTIKTALLNPVDCLKDE
ncbi:MAG: ABC transporter permease, partial [Bacteroidota bacterium]